MAKLFYSNTDLEKDLSEITRQIHVSGFKPDVVIGPGRGAYVMGVMLSHYFEVPFEAFRWQTRDGNIEDSGTLRHILSKYKGKKILLVDDINDTGKTLQGIDDVITDYASTESNAMLNYHSDIKYATLFDKESSNFEKVDFTSNIVLPDQERWIVFPYEEWWK